MFVGHGTIRGRVVGEGNRAPAPEELAWMQAMVAEAMQDGAFGLSSGLEYAPGMYATGVRHVFVNGQAVLLDGTPTGARPGRALRSTD